MANYSVSPAGEKFPLPGPEDDAREFARVQALAAQARADGKEIVVVMGVGFVGAVMAAIVADSVGPDGKPGKFVIGCQRPSARSYWKIPLLARGESPVKAEDPEVDPMIRRTVIEKKTLVATHNSDCLGAGRLRGRGRAVRLLEARPGQDEDGQRRDDRARGDDADDRREDPAVVPGADRNDRGAGHDRVRRVADHEAGVRRARHRVGAAAGPQLRARDAGPRVRPQHPRFLAGVLRLHARGQGADGEVPRRGPQHRATSR